MQSEKMTDPDEFASRENNYDSDVNKNNLSFSSPVTAITTDNIGFNELSDKGDPAFDYDGIDSDLVDNDISHNVYFVDDVESTAFCEPYRGTLCSHLIGKRMIYVTSEGQQDATEKQLVSSNALNYFLHTGTHVTEECGQSVLFLACIYAFPLCNEQSTFAMSKIANSPSLNQDIPKYVRARQLCRVDCNYVHDVACKAFFKDTYTNPFRKLNLPTCVELPPSSSHADCVSLTYLRNDDPKSNHHCYNKTGKFYRGLVANSASGKPCLPWSSVTSRKEYRHLTYITHPELGNHQYCRNPQEDLIHQSPWCFVQRSSYLGNSEISQETCNIPKCRGILDSDLWMVIVPSVFIPIGLALLLIFTYLICCKRKTSAKHHRTVSGYSSESPTDNCYSKSNNFVSSNKKKRKFFYRSTSSGKPISLNPHDAQLSFDTIRNNVAADGSLLSFPNTLSGRYATTVSNGNNLATTPLLASHNSDLMIQHNHGRSSSNAPRSVSGGISNQTSESMKSICHDILPSQVHYVKEIGEGRYGLCYIAELSEGVLLARNTPRSSSKNLYFVRTLKKVDLLDQFLSDCNALTAKPPKHSNLACLIGLCHEPPSAFFEYLQFDLHDLLVKQRRSISGGVSTVVGIGVKFSKHLAPILEKVATALEYLSSRNLAHKDVAARNVLLSSEHHVDKVKLCDFASCRLIYSSDYYRLGGSMLPVRWMSPESVLTGSYTPQSDVWSFGILLWEFCALGRRPHDDATNPEVVERLRDRHLLALPVVCSGDGSSTSDQQNLSILRGIMLECWAMNPGHRPYACDLVIRLRNLIDCSSNTSQSCLTNDRNNRVVPQHHFDAFQFKV
ncbi:hypothetical protein GJ496_002677 [Pomphorhynchus laevis]|nr:hypothetical protein GJ496_002677 [Pomphorhynchus laevis]